jgi:hypothetical protein
MLMLKSIKISYMAFEPIKQWNKMATKTHQTNLA